MNYERLFQALAIVVAAAAGFFLWRVQTDAAFVTGVLAAVSYFISLRIQIKERLAQRSADEAEDDEIHVSAE